MISSSAMCIDNILVDTNFIGKRENNWEVFGASRTISIVGHSVVFVPPILPYLCRINIETPAFLKGMA